MKKIFKYLFLAATIFGCEPEENEVKTDLDDQLKNPPINVAYDAVVSGYQGKIVSGLPTWNGTNNVTFNIESIVAEDSTFNMAINNRSTIASIDSETGIVSLESNSKISVDDLPVGKYFVNIGTDFIGGTVMHDSVLEFNIVDLPLDVIIPTVDDIPVSKTGDLGVISAKVNNPADYPDLTVESYKIMGDVVDGIELDSLTGVISKTRTDIEEGDYVFPLEIGTNNGVKYLQDSLRFTILPLNLFIEYTSVVEKFGYIGSLGTPTLTGLDKDGLTEIKYSMMNEVSGVTINEETGELSKLDLSTPNGVHQIGVKVETNYGIKEYPDVFTLEISGKPNATVQKDGNTINLVTLSSWSSFTGLTIDIDKDALGDENPTYTLSSTLSGVTITEDGTISFTNNGIIAEGDYPVDITVLVNGEFEVAYPAVFTVKVLNRWTNAVVEDFKTASGSLVDTEHNGFSATIFEGTPTQPWNYVTKGEVKLARVQAGKNAVVKSALIKEIPMTSSVKKIKISYRETIGFGEGAAAFMHRSIRMADNNEADMGAWTELKNQVDNPEIWTDPTNAKFNSNTLKEEEMALIELEIDAPEYTNDNFFFGMFVEMNTENNGVAESISYFSYQFTEAYEAEYTNE